MPFPTVIDNTMRSAFISCPESWHKRFIQHLDELEPSIHLHAGAAFASAIEEFRKAYWGSRRLSFDDAFEAGAATLVHEYGDFDDQGQVKSLYNMLRAYDYYWHEAFPPATDQMRPFMLPNGEPAVEFSFAIPLPINHPDTGEAILYGGKFDMVGQSMGQLWVVDEKTTGSMGPQWAKQWSLRSQFTGYCWAAQQFGYRVAGVSVRGIGIYVTDMKNAPIYDYRPPWVIDRWYAQLIRDVQRMVDAYKSGIYDMALSDACNSFGGCAFKMLCESRDPEPFMKTHFVKREWIPVAEG